MNTRQKIWGAISAATATLGAAGTAGLTTFQMMTTAAVEGGMQLSLTGTAALIGIGSAAAVSLVLAIPLFYFSYKFYVKKREALVAKQTAKTNKKNKEEERLKEEIFDLAIHYLMLKLKEDAALLDKTDKITLDPHLFSGVNNNLKEKRAIDKKMSVLEDLVNAMRTKLSTDKTLGGAIFVPGAGFNSYAAWQAFETDYRNKGNLQTLRKEFEKDPNIQTAYNKILNGNCDSEKLITTPKIKSKFKDSLVEGFFGVFGFLGTFASVLGPSFTVSGLVIGTAASVGTMLAVTPIIGWAVLGGALLLSLSVGAAYAYYTNQNNKIKNNVAHLKQETRQIKDLREVVHEYKRTAKHAYEGKELTVLKQDKSQVVFDSLDNARKQAECGKAIAEQAKLQAEKLAVEQQARAANAETRAMNAETRAANAETRADYADKKASALLDRAVAAENEVVALRIQLKAANDNSNQATSTSSGSKKSTSPWSLFSDNSGNKRKEKEQAQKANIDNSGKKAPEPQHDDKGKGKEIVPEARAIIGNRG